MHTNRIFPKSACGPHMVVNRRGMTVSQRATFDHRHARLPVATMADSPRLLFACFDVIPAPTGLSRRITEYVRALGDELDVVVLSVKSPDLPHAERFLGGHMLRVPVGTGDLHARILAFERAVKRQLESDHFTTVHFFDPFAGYPLCEAKPKRGFRVVYDAANFPSQEFRYSHPQTEGDRRFLNKIRRQELFCLMNADAVVTGSDVTRNYITGLGVPPETVRVVHAPVDRTSFMHVPLPAAHDGALRVGYLGSLLGYQGLPTVLRGIAKGAASADITLQVVGPRHPDWQVVLDSLVKELDIGARVQFQAPVPHDKLPKVLGGWDVATLPLDDVERNQAQGGPLSKLADYLAAGRPVVAADLAVTRELLPQAAGRFFRPQDSDALAAILVELAKDAPARKAMGEAARVGAMKFDSSGAKNVLLEVYRLAATGRVAIKVRDVEEERAKTDPNIQVVAMTDPFESAPKTDRHASLVTSSDPPTDPTVRTVTEDDIVAAEPTPKANLPPTLATPATSNAPTPLNGPPPLKKPLAKTTTHEVPVQEVATPVSDVPAQPSLNAWFAQIAHGYTPPSNTSFVRPAPPTNFPGRDEALPKPGPPPLKKS